ncbi:MULTISPECIES: 50S ribosomal protein L18 [unclassified Oceanispirochaeta]|uniref:50S ribosomal protein L18 n=1 Tax=unclassified Oceanispirochaeta TaxID=2635722 RepID=UPI000E09C889|nr:MULTISPECIES: 50S ribosomal protein L18 [unclassified Oceanispirochaeta]MBF9017145.1 50S ribosomal protein L18 [Oceanispirochaeta sp. M2]NPD73594.1 50S ribosomal protein L18 [Oceanispirochaeta sp. M1]RDG30698.1 50S ribosomal protein L18 [Oceanispirochaeta sp. M1]
MDRIKQKQSKRLQRKKHVRKKISGTAERPRLTVFKSNKNISLQVIDDIKGHTLLSVSTLEKDYTAVKINLEGGSQLGKVIGERMKAAGITTIVFDRNGYMYHGIVKAIAEAARAEGIQF